MILVHLCFSYSGISWIVRGLADMEEAWYTKLGMTLWARRHLLDLTDHLRDSSVLKWKWLSVDICAIRIPSGVSNLP